MLCRKCKKDIQEGSCYCNYCGAKQDIARTKKKSKVRGNGEGTVYKMPNNTWKAEVTLGFDEKEMPDGTIKLLRRKATKSGFASKKEALEYIPQLKQQVPGQNPDIKFKDLYKKWFDIHSEKVVESTLGNYKAAYKYFSSLYYVEFNKIRTEHMQKCIDSCPKGRRTKENMKALGTCLSRYAMQLDIVEKNYAEYIYIPKEEATEKVAFSKEQIALMWKKVEHNPKIRYVLLLCYTGMRLGEMLNALTANYNREEEYFTAGSKTKAGKNRIITISPRIKPFFKKYGKGEYLFFDDGKRPSEKKFRNDIFYPALIELGIDTVLEDGTHLYTPHCCRHTFATLMKDVDAPTTDKQKLIGHSSFEMTAHYTHTDLDSLRNITNRI